MYKIFECKSQNSEISILKGSCLKLTRYQPLKTILLHRTCKLELGLIFWHFLPCFQYHIICLHSTFYHPCYIICVQNGSSDIRGNFRMPQYLSLFNGFPLGGNFPWASLGPSLLIVKVDYSTLLYTYCSRVYHQVSNLSKIQRNV